MTDKNSPADADKELATRQRIARHNGVPLESVPTAAELDDERRNAVVTAHNAAVDRALERGRPPRSYEQGVILRLTAITWFVGFIAAVVLVALIVVLVSVAVAASSTPSFQ